MASKVTPSMPGAPSFSSASSYASRSVSILQTCTYSPQKRQDVSVFALTYSLRLRSCKLIDAFVISSLPSRLKETLQSSRVPSLRGRYPTSLLLRTRPPPSRLRSTSRFGRLYDLPYSDDFAPGRERLHQLLGVSLSPCCRLHPAEVECRIGQISASHVAFALQRLARPSDRAVSRPHLRLLSLRPGDS